MYLSDQPTRKNYHDEKHARRWSKFPVTKPKPFIEQPVTNWPRWRPRIKTDQMGAVDRYLETRVSHITNPRATRDRVVVLAPVARRPRKAPPGPADGTGTVAFGTTGQIPGVLSLPIRSKTASAFRMERKLFNKQVYQTPKRIRVKGMGAWHHNGLEWSKRRSSETTRSPRFPMSWSALEPCLIELAFQENKMTIQPDAQQVAYCASSLATLEPRNISVKKTDKTRLRVSS